jgi:hypothetical protein
MTCLVSAQPRRDGVVCFENQKIPEISLQVDDTKLTCLSRLRSKHVLSAETRREANIPLCPLG